MPFLHVLTDKEKRYLEQLAQNLQALRKEKRLSQAQLAFEISTSRTHYLKIEKGEVNPGIILLLRLAEILDVSLNELLPNDAVQDSHDSESN